MPDGDEAKIGAYDEHDQAVMNRINGLIAEANAKFPKLTIAEKLDWAWSENIKRREEDSTDTVGRISDDYFAAPHMVAADKSEFAKHAHAGAGLVAWPVYSLLKLGAGAVGHPEWTRTDKDKPNAPVGGFIWMNRGSNDGFKDRGEETSDIIPHQPQVASMSQKEAREFDMKFPGSV
jgi:hypothetical protein